MVFKRLFSYLLAAVLILCSSVASAETDISSGTIQAEGIGAAAQPAAAGYRAAKVDAYRNLLETIKGVSLDAETTVEMAFTVSDTIKTKVAGTVQGARVVKQYKDADGYHVILEAPMYGVNSVAAAVIDAVIPPAHVPAPLPEPAQFSPAAPPALPAPSGGNYTGVVVDCSGLGLSTAMAPGIFSENLEIVYGLENFSREQVVNRGYVGYSKSVDSGTGRAGVNPLVVKAVSIHKFVNPVISGEDAAKILAANKSAGFLAAGNVVFVK